VALFFTILLGLVACTAPTVDTGTDMAVIDLRATYPPPPEGGVQILTPDMEIAPGEEELRCLYQTWTEPDVGVVSYVPLHPWQYHHHSLLKDIDHLNLDVEDGDFLPCFDSKYGVPGEYQDASGAPMFQAYYLSLPQGDGDWLSLPEGFAFRLAQGTQFSADVHYINTTDKTLLVNDAFNLGLIPAEEVETWLSPIELDSGSIYLPPMAETSVRFSCAMPADVGLLSVNPHMHELGSRYLIELVRTDGSVTELLSLGSWAPEYRNSAPNRAFQPGQVALEAGDSIRTTCTWINPHEHTVEVPEEMCTTSGVVSGLPEPYFCDGYPTQEIF
jgi:hypothetical protein